MALHRAFSLLTVKEVNEGKRIITGVASSPKPDRMEDVVEPMGAQFATPMPLLLYHNGEKPVGNVDFAKPKKTGIPFEASLPIISESGTVKDRVEEAWHSVKYRLIAAVSIGFRALEGGVELLSSGGLRFTSWEWLELSLVSVPAQPDAVIHSFKSMDLKQIQEILGTHPSDSDADREQLIKTLREQLLAASGHTQKRVVKLINPGVSGTPVTARRGGVQLIPRK